MKIIDACFVKSSASLKDSLSPDIAEVAFLGRSNVGKSSLLNSLTHKKSLAKASSTPGKTRLINFFDVKFKNEEDIYKARFVDLPGFGYARVSKSIKEEWGKNLTDFLQKRESLRIFVHLIDSRHPDLEIDKSVNEFLNYIKRGDQIIINAFTKIDKLNQSELSKLRARYPDGIFITNLKNKGMEELTLKLSNYLFGIPQ